MNEVVVVSVLKADDTATFATSEAPSIQVELGGIPGDRHFGILVPSDSRQTIYPRGTMIANRRQLSIVSVEECREIAERMGVPEIKPEWLGANILVSGLDKLTALPLGMRMLFPDGTGLICEGENEPCLDPGKLIGKIYGREEIASKFVKAAYKRRGIVCSVEREGKIAKGDAVRIVKLS
ncbi:MOSC domain-containing protein [Cohnella lupini]|uniref:MOSC domain-containing protein n=1 Tax=Cohnella lupini TaxID=1294267 RepID=A0A3D9IJ59_9BACL|nr:MOSC domain-containing protein [Cohnella lupini]RED61768.1 MOSC domain-containing protein [Cohnella lupini]